MILEIYTKPHCIQCKMTNNLVQSLHIPHDRQIIQPETETGQKAIEHLKSTYHIQQLPFVRVLNSNQQEIERWVGFQPDKIKKYRDE